MFRVVCLCVALVLSAQCVFADNPVAEPISIRYVATLSQSNPNGTTESLREFGLQTLVVPRAVGFPTVYYLMADQSADDQPWDEQFGRFEFDAEGHAAPVPQQRHLHDGRTNWIGLRFGFYPGYAALMVDQEWEEGTSKFRVFGEKAAHMQPAWQLEINAPQGKRTVLSIQKSTGAILSANHRFFVGQGEQFQLNFRLEQLSTPEASTVATWTQAMTPLLALKSQLKRPQDAPDTPLTSEQLKLASKSLDGIDRATDGTPFAELAGVIRRAVTTGQQKEHAVAELAKRFEGRPAPAISVTSLEGGDAIKLAKPAKVTVLHFWDYRDAPLTEPYGQIGYLDFLAQKRGGKINVYGINTDKRLDEASTAPQAQRSARKLKEFMNLGYPITQESEGALAALGDPRKIGVDLPLWVVIGTDGTILHYRIGFYEVDTRKGLEELDAVIEKALGGK